MDVLVFLLVFLWSSDVQAQENSTNVELDFKLVDGANRCEGLLKVKMGNDWRSVVADWSVLEANQLCGQLGCGSAASSEEEKLWPRPEYALVVNHDCVRKELRLSNCVSETMFTVRFLKIICSESLRLVSDSSLCSGRLEVKSAQFNQSWSTVCESGFHQQDANVVCRELGCGPPLVLQGALHEDGDLPMLSRQFRCTGNESALLSCESSDAAGNACSSGKAAEITCSEFRLKGRRRCAGKVEVAYKSSWKLVNGLMTSYNLHHTNVVCRKLDCGTALSTQSIRESDDPLYVSVFYHSLHSGNHLRDSAKKKYSFFQSWHITCSDSVRLVNGSSLCSGRLQVRSASSQHSWSSVCESDFDRQDAAVVCRELGCGAPSVIQGGLYGEARGPMWPKSFRCEGSERSLLRCKSASSGRAPCSVAKAVGLTCSEPVRFVGGDGGCEGRVELGLYGKWRPLGEGMWSLTEAPLLCEKLGCGSAVTFNTIPFKGYGLAWMALPECIRSGTSMRDCAHIAGWTSIIELKCAHSVRLVNGPSLCSGRLEVKVDQSWLPVCESDFDRRDAEVVCREIGCGTPSDLQGGLYGEAEGPMCPREFFCGGSESSLQGCESSTSSRKTCSPGRAVGLTCMENIRLVGGPNRCTGIIEVKHEVWRSIDVEYSDWTLKDARPFCKMLDCGSPVLQRRNDLGTHTTIWGLNYKCVRAGFPVRQCLRGTKDSRAMLEISCLETLRLVNSSSLCSGRLELKSNKTWSPVNEYDFDRRDAEVVCRELGCGPPFVLQGGLYGAGDAPMWPREFHCTGRESSLLNCESSDSERDTNLPGKAVGLKCSEPVRLVGGPSSCMGTLEVKHKGQWTPVTGVGKDRQDHMCRELGCGFLLTSENGPVLSVVHADHNCLNDGFSVKDCISYSAISNSLAMNCSGTSTGDVV